MKINNIKIKNIKNVSEFDLDLNGATVLVVGGNNKGKSTILKSLIDRLRGEKPELIVKHGEKEGRATMELTDKSLFEWEIKDGKEKLTYTAKDGVKTSAVKDIVKKYFPDIFDIDVFLQSRPQEQLKTLQKLVGVDFTVLDQDYKKAYEERQILNRMYAEEKIKTPAGDLSYLKKEKFNAQVLLIDLDLLTAKAEERKNLEQEIGAIKKRIENYKKELVQAEVFLAQKEKILSQCGPCADDKIVALKNKLLEVESHNSKVDAAVRAVQAQQALAALRVKAETADTRVEEIKQAKKNLIAAAKLPSGISIEDEEIKINGLPLNKNQIGTALLYMTALRLAATQLGQVRTLHFEASALDKKSLAEILSWAQQEGLQLLIERADFDGGDITYNIYEN
jgi:hypothetical protein